jgi:hypothetical protein
VYGQTNPAFTVSYSSFVLGQNQSVLGGSLAFTTAGTSGSPVGTYNVTPSGLSSANYAITFYDGTLTITKAPLLATTNPQTKVYGAANPTLTGTFTGIRSGDNITAVYSTAADATSAVGPYHITATLVDPGNKLGNYTVTNNGNTLTITKAPLSVTPANKTKQYLAPNPPLTGTISGIQNGDNITASYSTTAVQSTLVGVYAITATLIDPTNKLGNYSVTLNQATLTVLYRFDGFLQPINDTAHTQMCGSPCPLSVFKAGSTVPVKFVLKDVNGNVLVPGANAFMPVWMVPQDHGTTSALIDESTFTDTPTPGSTFTWDGSQYHFNWKTSVSMAGHIYVIGAILDDGEVVTVNIGLK